MVAAVWRSRSPQSSRRREEDVSRRRREEEGGDCGVRAARREQQVNEDHRRPDEYVKNFCGAGGSIATCWNSQLFFWGSYVQGIGILTFCLVAPFLFGLVPPRGILDRFTNPVFWTGYPIVFFGGKPAPCRIHFSSMGCCLLFLPRGRSHALGAMRGMAGD